MPHCFLCYKNNLNSFFNAENFKKHIKLFHKLGSCDIYTCFNCEKQFQNRKTFFKHVFKTVACKSENVNNPGLEYPLEGNNYSTDNDTSELLDNDTIEFNTTESIQISPQKLQFFDNSRAESNLDHSKIMENNALKIVCDLYGNFLIPRKDATNTIISINNNLIHPMLNILETSILPKLELMDKLPITNLFHILNDSFKNFKSFHLFQTYLVEHDLYQHPIIFEISNEISPIVINNTATLDECKTYGALMPIKFQIKKFLQLPHVLDEIIQTINNYKDIHNLITSVIHGEIWKKRIRNINAEIVIPYVLYFDEFEIDNPLGSHSGEHSISALYYYFPVMPKFFLSNLSNIFVALLFETKNKKFGYGNIFQPLIDEINQLSKEGQYNRKNILFHIF